MAFRLSPFRRSTDEAPARRAYEHLFRSVAATDGEPPVTDLPPEVDGSVAEPTLDATSALADDAPPPTTQPDPFDAGTPVSTPPYLLRPRRDGGYRGAALLALVLLASAVAVWFVAAEVLRGVEEGAAALRGWENEQRRALVAIALVTSALLSLIIAWGRATSPRRSVRLAGGRGTIAVDVIAERLRTAIAGHPHVRDASVRVENRHGRGVRVEVELRVGALARIDDTVDAVDDVVTELLHRGLGVAMESAPAVRVMYDELDLRAGRSHG